MTMADRPDLPSDPDTPADAPRPVTPASAAASASPSGPPGSDPGMPADDPGTPAVDPGTASIDPGTVPIDPGTASVDPGTASVGRFDRRTVLGAGALAIAATVGLTAMTAPRPSRLGDPTGDEQITVALAGSLSGYRSVAIALLDEGTEPRFAGFGAQESDEFEIGSITKVFTGALLAQAISRGDVTVETTVAEVLGDEAEGSEIADVTFAELATHSAGLPTAPASRSPELLAGTYLHRDPYGAWGAEHLVADALTTSPSTRGQHVYSNLSVSLEGQLLSRIAGAPYEELIEAELIEPLGLASTYLPITSQGLRETARRGHTTTGLPAGAWTMNGYAPSGGIRSTARDVAAFLAATRDGTAPGADAAGQVLFEQDEFTSLSINWIHSRLSNDSTIIWHNGVTGGYAAFAGWDTDSGRGIVLLTDTADPVEGIGFDVLTGGIQL